MLDNVENLPATLRRLPDIVAEYDQKVAAAAQMVEDFKQAVTAATDHRYIEVPKWGREVWEDLPIGSFSESGTNINTGIARFGPAA